MFLSRRVDRIQEVQSNLNFNKQLKTFSISMPQIFREIYIYYLLFTLNSILIRHPVYLFSKLCAPTLLSCAVVWYYVTCLVSHRESYVLSRLQALEDQEQCPIPLCHHHFYLTLPDAPHQCLK